MARVFLSYARDDRSRAAELAGALERAGHIVWWDHRLTGGAEFAREIEKALANADIVVVAWSEAASNSHWVRDEAAAGRDSDRLVPVTLDGTRPPLGFRQFYTIDLADWSGETSPRCPELEAAISAKAGVTLPATSESVTLAATKRRARTRHRLPLWAWSLFVGPLLITAAAWWWFTRPSPGPQSLMLGRFEVIGEGVAPGVPEAIAQEIRASLGSLRVPLLAGDGELVLTGTVRRVGNLLRLAVSLEEVATSVTLWSASHDLPPNDAAAMSERARSIATVMECGQDGLRGHQRRLRSEDISLYLRYCEASEEGAIQMLNAARAVTVAVPEFIGGWLGIATSVHLQVWTLPSGETADLVEEGLAAARRAVEMRPEISDGYSLLAALTPPEQSSEREALLRRAVGLQSFGCDCAEQYLGDFLIQTGRAEEALAMYRRGLAQQSQGHQMDALWRAATANYLTGLTNNGDALLQQLEQLHPNHPSLIHARRNAALWAGRWGDAAELFRLARPEEQSAVRAVYFARQSGNAARLAEAGAALERLPVRPRVETIIIPALAQAGRLDAAFRALEASLRSKRDYSAPGRFPGITVPMLWDPLLRPVWNDRRFPSFLQRAGFISYWRQSGSRPDICTAADAPAFCRMLSGQG